MKYDLKDLFVLQIEKEGATKGMRLIGISHDFDPNSFNVYNVYLFSLQKDISCRGRYSSFSNLFSVKPLGYYLPKLAKFGLVIDPRNITPHEILELEAYVNLIDRMHEDEILVDDEPADDDRPLAPSDDEDIEDLI